MRAEENQVEKKTVLFALKYTNIFESIKIILAVLLFYLFRLYLLLVFGC